MFQRTPVPEHRRRGAAVVVDARGDPGQWRRRGLTPPAELAAMVEARLGWLPIDDPTSADFFFDPLDGSVGEVRA